MADQEQEEEEEERKKRLLSCPKGLAGTNPLCCGCWRIRFLPKTIYFLRRSGNINLTEPLGEAAAAAACFPEAPMALRSAPLGPPSE